MTIGTIDESQRKAATVVGFSYLFALAPAIFAEFYVRTQLITFDNAAQTAQNIRFCGYSVVRSAAHTLFEWPKLDSLDGDGSATLEP